MQDKQAAASLEKKYRYSALLLLAKLAVTVFVFYYVYTSLGSRDFAFRLLWDRISTVLVKENALLIVVLLGLCPVNWLLESLKWQLLLRRAVKVTLGEAVRGTLAGLAVGLAMPAQLGDTLGRVASVGPASRWMAVGPALVSNGIQFYVSLVAGIGSLYGMKTALPVPAEVLRFLLLILSVLAGAGIAVGVFRKPLTHWETRHRLLKKAKPYLEVIGAYSGRELAAALCLGSLRYLVFTLQFVLALVLFGFDLGWSELFCGAGVIFLVKTLVPALNIIGDLGMREFTALLVFQQYGIDPLQVVAATLTVWAVNIPGPALAGLAEIWKRRFGAPGEDR